MKKSLIQTLALVSLAFAPAGFAQLNIPGDGSDGVFAPLTNVVIDLSQAVTGSWDMNNTANAGRGVYDPEKWAVVFKFQSVTVLEGVTVRFANHPSRAPVVWLVQSNVVIDGEVNLKGEPADDDASLANINKQGGPGGFRGGLGKNPEYPNYYRNGMGPGDCFDGWYYNSYGNAQILPLIGGFGMLSYAGGRRGAGGGGAILIACACDIGVEGSITADGGDSWLGGAGGAIRLVAREVRGGGVFYYSRGRFRLECITHHLTNPAFADSFPVNPGPTPVIWPPSDAPKARIASVAGNPVPDEPLAALNGQPDLTIAVNQPVDVMIETKNFPIEGSVSLRVIPKYSNAFWVSAQYVSGSFAQALWKATPTFPTAYCAMIVRAAAP
jgi:hypothetical protein